MMMMMKTMLAAFLLVTSAAAHSDTTDASALFSDKGDYWLARDVYDTGVNCSENRNQYILHYI